MWHPGMLLPRVGNRKEGYALTHSPIATSSHEDFYSDNKPNSISPVSILYVSFHLARWTCFIPISIAYYMSSVVGFLSCSNSRAKESSTFGPFHFHFNSVAALRVLLVWARARWLVDMVSGVGGILPENFCQKCLL